MLDKTIVRKRRCRPNLRPVNLTYYLGQGIDRSNKPLGKQVHPKLVRFFLGLATGDYESYLVIPSTSRTRLSIWLLEMLKSTSPRQPTSQEFLTRLSACEFLSEETKNQWKVNIHQIL